MNKCNVNIPCHKLRDNSRYENHKVPVKKDLHIAEEQHALLSEFFCLIVKTARLT